MLQDPVSNIRIEPLLDITFLPSSTGDGTDYEPSYSAGSFTRAFDARPYMAAIIVVPVADIGANVTATIKLQKADGPDFGTFTDISGGAFTALTSANDETVVGAKIDLSKHQNAVGLHINVAASSGTNRARIGAYAILLPYDTTNAGFTSDFQETLDLT